VTTPDEVRQRRWLWLGAPIAAHVALCAAHVVFLSGSPLLRYLTLDLKSYDSWARAIAAGDVLGKGVFYQDPLYPYLMAFVYKLTGADVVHVLVLQIVASALTLWALFALAEALFGVAVARISIWAAALYGPSVYYAGKPEKACLAALALTSAFTALVGAARKPALFRWGAAGLLLGAASLLRGNVLVVSGVLLALVLATHIFAEKWNERMRAAGGLAAGLLVVLLPVLVRNRVVGEDWVFTTSQAGANLYIGNNAGNATGTYAVPSFVRPSPMYEEEDFRKHAENVLERRLLPSEVSRFYVGAVASWALGDPKAFLKLQLTKALAFVDRWEYPDNWSLYFVRGFSPVLRLPLLGYAVVLPFALLGLVLALARPPCREARGIALLVAAYATSIVAFFVFSRYRFPIAYALIVLAAHGAVSVGAWARERRWRRVAAATAAVALGFAVSIFGKRNDEAGDLSQRYYNLSASFLNDGRFQAATAQARQAAAVDPKNHLPHLTLAEVAALTGDSATEHDELAEAYRLRPDSEEVRAKMIIFDARRAGYDAAASLAKAWLAAGESYLLRQALVGAALDSERFAEARVELSELVRRFPGDTWGNEQRVALAVHERDWQEVIGAAESLSRTEQGETRWSRVLAIAYHEAGEPAAAERHARRAGLPWPLPRGAALQDPLRTRLHRPLAARP
jgi:4-amino-4-deoxy-L-arabinose transferase-like glycosyltransferase